MRVIDAASRLKDAQLRRHALALARLRDTATASDNILPTTIEAVTAYATIGEIVDVLRVVHGTWTPTATF